MWTYFRMWGKSEWSYMSPLERGFINGKEMWKDGVISWVIDGCKPYSSNLQKRKPIYASTEI